MICFYRIFSNALRCPPKVAIIEKDCHFVTHAQFLRINHLLASK